MGAVTDEDAEIEKGIEAGREAGIQHIRCLHWGLHPLGSLNDVWYCVKGFGMVNSAGGGVLTLSHLVVNGYSKVFHDVFGGPLSQFAEDGRDQSLSGWHARSAVGGFDLPAGVRAEPEMIVQIDPELALRINPGEWPSCLVFVGEKRVRDRKSREPDPRLNPKRNWRYLKK